MDQDDVLGSALDWVNEGRRVAIASVVETWGSSPRPRGSLLAVRDDGLFAGSVSGGCVEGKVVLAAQEAMLDGAHRLLEFGVSNEEAWEVGLACGGTVHIYVAPVEHEESNPPAPLDRELLQRVRKAREEKGSLVLLTPLDGGKMNTWTADAPPLEPAVAEAAARALATDDATRVETASGPIFVQAFNPSLKLIIVGAVHIAEPLARMAKILAYEVTVIDPRDAFARAERWPEITVKCDWPDEVLGAMTLDHRTAIVALTHDPKIDDPALEAALKSRAFYVGALGSKKTHGARLRRLGERGFPDEILAKIHGPIGLRIGARSPAEIAISILGQMTAALRGAPQ